MVSSDKWLDLKDGKTVFGKCKGDYTFGRYSESIDNSPQSYIQEVRGESAGVGLDYSVARVGYKRIDHRLLTWNKKNGSFKLLGFYNHDSQFYETVSFDKNLLTDWK